jgi:hypothetical protein
LFKSSRPSADETKESKTFKKMKWAAESLERHTEEAQYLLSKKKINGHAVSQEAHP